MKKSDVEISYHQGTSGSPMINVKVHRFDPTEEEWAYLEAEFPGFRAWLQVIEDTDPIYHEELLNDSFTWAQEGAWEMVQDDADEIFGVSYMPDLIRVYSAGRSGGWCVVEGLPDVESWDAIALARWAKFARYAHAQADDMAYQTHWTLAANRYESDSPVTVTGVPSFS